jgi:hypothetical protein
MAARTTSRLQCPNPYLPHLVYRNGCWYVYWASATSRERLVAALRWQKIQNTKGAA